MRKPAFLFILFFCWILPAEEYRFSGDRSTSVIREGSEETRIEGNVLIRSSERNIEADEIRIIGKDEKLFEGSGSVRIEDFSRNMILESDRFRYDEKKSYLLVEGRALLEDRENEVLIKCSRLEYFQDEELAVMQLNVRIFKDDIVCRAEYARFYRDRDLLELSGTPLVFRGDDRYEADRIEVNLSTDEITMYGAISGSMVTGAENE